MKLDKDPAARLDYKWDWSDWLEATETVTSAVVVAAGLTVEAATPVDAGKAVTCWISGGTAGQVVNAICHITTSVGRQDDRTIELNITSR